MSDFLYGCSGGPKNNGMFSYMDENGRFRLGSNNRPRAWTVRLQLSNRDTVRRKYGNLWNYLHKRVQ